jgi:hypothetical protein
MFSLYKFAYASFSRYVHSGVETITSYGLPVVDCIDARLDSISSLASDFKQMIVRKFNNSKEEVISKAIVYKTAISEQVQTTISSANVTDFRSRVEESVKQAPEVVRSLSNKAVSLTKQGLEISIGHEKTETVLNSVKTHTPKFVSSLLRLEQADAPLVAGPAAVAAH